ncbi:unnamed protein product [Agarophyton chilense]
MAPVYSANVVGLGQIAPPKAPASRVPSAAGSAASSHRSSAVSSVSLGSLGAASSTGALSSTGAPSSSAGMAHAASMDMDMSMDAFRDGALESSARAAAKQKGKLRKDRSFEFLEHVETAFDSDDDMPDDAFDNRNCEIAPYAGHLTDEGILLPVSLPGLRDMPQHFADFVEDDLVSDLHKLGNGFDSLFPTAKAEPKAEPMAIEQPAASQLSTAEILNSDMFTEGTVARKLLSSESSLAFLQLPGLLTLSENPTAANIGEEQRPHEPSKQTSVAAAVTAGERMRGLGTDLRRVGEPGTAQFMGKLRFFKSGRVQLVMQCGDVIDLEHGVEPKVCQQVVLVDKTQKSCDEMSNGYMPKVVGIPSLGLA